ncbi:MAG TPA: hypothetical protein PLV92_20800, partial [Pirellulaceae bacterium]|nr:hypothetical protein [Pirellulaceae bacterium]
MIVSLGVAMLLGPVPTAPLHAQIGATPGQFAASMQHVGDAAVPNPLAGGAALAGSKYQFHARQPLLGGLECTAVFADGRAASVEWGPFSWRNSSDQSLALIARFGGVIVPGRPTKPGQLALHNGFTSVYPAVGAWSVHFYPITKTVAKSRTVMIDLRTGRQVGSTPWSDVSIPTGEWDTIYSSEIANLGVLVNHDATQYMTLLATKSTYDFQVQSVEFANPSSFWSRVFRSIETGYGPYESRLARVVHPRL